MAPDDEVVVEPEEIMDTRYDQEGFLEALIKWKHLRQHESSWMKVSELKHRFPSFSLEDKVRLEKRGIDMLRRVYVRRKKEREAREELELDV